MAAPSTVLAIVQAASRPVAWCAALALAVGCRQTPVILQGGTVRVTFDGEETCGFDNPHVAEATGCRLIDDRALMCRGFGVIDGVLFAGGCEAPASLEVLDVTGTVPIPQPSQDSDEGGGA